MDNKNFENTAVGLGTDRLLTVTPPPHIKRRSNVRTVMIEVIIAMLPAVAWGTYVFGLRALLIVLISTAACVLSELLFELLLKRPLTVSDFSAAVTGVLLGMNLPVGVPLWMPVLGSVFAIVIVKQLFGGIGKNFLNPALAARAFLFISFPSEMSTYTAAFNRLPIFAGSSDIVASATVLSEIKGGIAPSASLSDLFIGRVGGSIGEVSALLLLVGGVYLVVRKIIQWQVPVVYLGVCAVMFSIFPQMEGSVVRAMLYELLSGGLILGAVFMATDYVTNPVTKWGLVIFAAGCGLLTFFFRVFGANAEGVSFAILIMNCLVYYIDRLTKPRIFGKRGRER